MSQQSLARAMAILLISISAGAQEQSSPPVIKHVPVKSTSSASGHEMYTSYCAGCHGADGKGGGPAASALKMPPANLTLLSKINGGKFPSDKVSAVLSETADLAAHGSKEMPVWGPLLSSVSHQDPTEVRMRRRNLTKYIESLQEK